MFILHKNMYVYFLKSMCYIFGCICVFLFIHCYLQSANFFKCIMTTSKEPLPYLEKIYIYKFADIWVSQMFNYTCHD